MRSIVNLKIALLNIAIIAYTWFASTLRAFRSSVRHNGNIWKRTHSAVDWSSFKSLRNQYHNLILAAKKHFYFNLVSSSSDNPKRLWQTVNKLLHLSLIHI